MADEEKKQPEAVDTEADSRDEEIAQLRATVAQLTKDNEALRKENREAFYSSMNTGLSDGREPEPQSEPEEPELKKPEEYTAELAEIIKGAF